MNGGSVRKERKQLSGNSSRGSLSELVLADLARVGLPAGTKSLKWTDRLEAGSPSSGSSESSSSEEAGPNWPDAQLNEPKDEPEDDDYQLFSGSNRTKMLLENLNNSSGKGIDVLNLPSTAELMAKQKAWIVINFRYRMRWYQAKPFLEKVSREDAYKPENLNHWTQYVRVSQHRKVPFINAVRAFRNRMQCPGIQMRYTLNSFYYKGADNERAKNQGPMHPVPLPVFRCPDDIPELRKMTNAIIDVFVTTDDTFFDDFWKDVANSAAKKT